MHESMIDIDTGEGLMNTCVYRPDEGGPFPLVVYYHDAAGVREAHADACRRIASCGYVVAMPNLFYRSVRHLDIDVDRFTDPAYGAQLALMNTLNAELTTTMAMRDTERLLAVLSGDRTVRAGKAGLLGYCMSGKFAYRAAGVFPDRIAAAIAMYGTRMITDAPDSAHLTTRFITAETYFGFAQHDNHLATAEIMPRIEALFAEAGVKTRTELYTGREHGFALRGRRVYHKPSAERHWCRIFNIFQRNLK